MPTEDDLVRLLIEAWTSALGVEATPESDFFALGGTSLAAISIADTVAEAYDHRDGIELVALEAIFVQPSLRHVAEQVSTFAASGAANTPA